MRVHEKARRIFKMLANPEIEVLSAYLINDTTLMVQYIKSEGFVQDPAHSNISIAAFTLAYARLKLYELLEFSEEKLLYFDTDSIVFISDGTEPEIKTGTFLGELRSYKNMVMTPI